jgi:hypothetical protein
MSADSIISMVLICGLVIGGFGYFVSKAMKSDKEK